jgi:hypothetical protein
MWIKFEQYPGWEIKEDASEIKIDGEVISLEKGKAKNFTNPVTGKLLRATPEVLLKRAQNPKPVAARTPSSSAPRKARSGTKKAEREAAKARRAAEREAKRLERQKKRELREAKALKRKKKKKQLVPDIVAHTFRERIKMQEKVGEDRNLYSGFFVEYNKSYRATILLGNHEEGTLLIKVEGPQNWRAGRFFYDPNTERYTEFVKDIHKDGWGNDSIKWPSLKDEKLFEGELDLHPMAKKAAKKLVAM